MREAGFVIALALHSREPVPRAKALGTEENPLPCCFRDDYHHRRISAQLKVFQERIAALGCIKRKPWLCSLQEPRRAIIAGMLTREARVEG
jgi:hypothetical protein